MNALLILIPVALILGGLGLAAFLWAMRSGQFDDLDGAAARILDENESGSDRAGENGAKIDRPRANKPDVRTNLPS